LIVQAQLKLLATLRNILSFRRNALVSLRLEMHLTTIVITIMAVAYCLF